MPSKQTSKPSGQTGTTDSTSRSQRRTGVCQQPAEPPCVALAAASSREVFVGSAALQRKSQTGRDSACLYTGSLCCAVYWLGMEFMAGHSACVVGSADSSTGAYQCLLRKFVWCRCVDVHGRCAVGQPKAAYACLGVRVFVGLRQRGSRHLRHVVVSAVAECSCCFCIHVSTDLACRVVGCLSRRGSVCSI